MYFKISIELMIFIHQFVDEHVTFLWLKHDPLPYAHMQGMVCGVEHARPIN